MFDVEVLCHGEAVSQRQFLVHDADATFVGGARGEVVQVDGNPVDTDRSSVRCLFAGQHPHQGALASAVSADDRGDLGRVEAERHIVHGVSGPEAFVDADDLNRHSPNVGALEGHSALHHLVSHTEYCKQYPLSAQGVKVTETASPRRRHP